MQAHDLVDHIHNHRCDNHPIFRHWAAVSPNTEAIGALFHPARIVPPP